MSEDYWGRFSQSYDNNQEYVVGTDLLKAINSKLDELPNLGDVVEFGCGTGYFTKTIIQKASSVCAADVSEELLAVAENRFKENSKITTQKENCMNTSFPPGKFDSVFMANLIHVVENPLKALQESNRILNENGLLIIVSFTNYGMKWYETIKLGFRFLKAWGKPPRHVQSFSPDKLGSLMETAGFTVEKSQLIGDRTKAIYLMGKKKNKAEVK